ncbi:hypothetical protein RJP21_06575 [Paenibacillus sp. VCA1]|uniref:hypothetical protein n=1 Tax=Paenibacillus sp. VCA1 TaxID=3039148 RepID=UPI0028712B7A|nr:hypothetical protein [Paenibacillus sp. VCA1]MDR9853268.1 hypothetical protein [Paenibacillus sp. VCA1]
MPKQIQAYFKTEDDAEQAKTKLIGIQAEHLEVGRLGTALEGNRHILLPIAPVGMTGSGTTTGASAAAGVSGVAYTPPVVVSPDDDDPNGVSSEGDHPAEEHAWEDRQDEVEPLFDPYADRYDDLEYVLSCKVRDKDYADVVNTLRNNGGYVEIFEDGEDRAET